MLEVHDCEAKQGAWRLSARSSSRVERLMNDDEEVEALHFAFAGQPAVDHSAAFRWHASSKKNRPS